VSVVNGIGVRVVVGRAQKIDRESIERSRDIAICRLKARGQSWRQIGAFLGISHAGARKRWQAMPQEAREHYQEAVG